MNIPAAEIFSVVMFFIGFYGLISNKNIIKSIISIGFMEMAVVVFFLSLGYVDGIKPPIGQHIENAADPLPQSLVITAIIIGVTVTAVILVMLISYSRQSKTTDWDIGDNINME